MHKLDAVLKHYGVKGMRWGVVRDRNRPGGADGVPEKLKVSTDEGMVAPSTVTKKGKIRKNLDSLKRERDWNKVVKEMDKLSTSDITLVSKRLGLENELKKYSNTKGVGKKKDKEDYLRRADMSNEELSRKVVRLKAKNNLKNASSDATKQQREFGERIVHVGGNLNMQYAMKRRLSPQDVFDVITDSKPKDSYKKSREDLLNTTLKDTDPAKKEVLDYALKTISEKSSVKDKKKNK